MQYQNYGNTGLKVSRLGYGVMRLPMIDKNVDMDKSIPLLRRAWELGINFFDTHHNYQNGQSEVAIGEALSDLDRSTYFLQTKHRTWSPLEEGESFRGNLETGLKKMKTDYVDCYLMHSLTVERFLEHKDRFFKEILKAKEEGLVRHIGLSTHDNPKKAIQLIDTGFFECLLVQYNYTNLIYGPVMAHAKSKGMGVSVMGPMGGGQLVPPNEITRQFPEGKHPVELALRFVLANENVDVALSGMNDGEQIQQNVAVTENPGVLTDDELIQLMEEAGRRKEMSDLFCTACNYCMPCPRDIDIPGNFLALSRRKIYGIQDQPQQMYDRFKAGDKGAIRCEACGKCLDKCPQKIDIPEKMKELVEEFDTAGPGS